jgi:hypothetical protein
MYLALHSVKRAMCVDDVHRVGLPHGAESGFDPYQAYSDLTEDSALEYAHGVMRPRGSPGEWVSSVGIAGIVCVCRVDLSPVSLFPSSTTTSTQFLVWIKPRDWVKPSVKVSGCT